ncbi:protein-glutamine gamma-glutamyltransferase 4-like [Clytia hemisphaerica]|uniref:Transglutaminase-like domain-containing protein n=1 Tax=Clytia hemisphaerica TaxID=252671 RepID=A0A7M5V8Z9_9CNID
MTCNSHLWTVLLLVCCGVGTSDARYIYIHPFWVWIQPEDVSVVSVDTKRDLNGRLHHTNQFKTDAMVVRRGQEFLLDVKLSTTFDPSLHSISLELRTGSRPNTYERTLIKIPMVKYLDKIKWGMRIVGKSDSTLQLKINIPARCLIANYELRIVNNLRKVLYTHKQPVYILFNPWSTEDEVYMPNASHLEEYVLNDQGVLFQGSANHISPLRWYFGQFEKISLESAFALLSTTKIRERDTARDISRRIAALVNSNDERGVLQGRWGSDFTGGTEPWAWTGSPAILEEYTKTKQPVKYGQCWNFCGLTTTLLRVVGIPTRAISNFNSAHDTDGNCTYDRFYDQNGEFLSRMSRDSTWNFHCWSDAWMERPDLPPGYGGWQAVDGTPQERSNGRYQTGPAPLRAIKEGNVKLKHDVRFLFAEVNADTVYWSRLSPDQEFRPIRVDRKLIGQNISTKAIGREQYRRVDITEDYKYPEGSALELITSQRALHLTNNKIVSDTVDDLKYSLYAQNEVMVGKDVVLRLHIKNTAVNNRNVQIMVGGHVLTYNGIAIKKLPMRKTHEMVHRQTDTYHTVSFAASQYLSLLKQSPRLRFHVFSSCSETSQIYVTETIVTLGRPELVFEQLPSYWKKGEELRFTVRVQNPLRLELTDCVLWLDGNIMESRLSLPQRNIPANSFHQVNIALVPQYEGRKNMIVTFSSKQLGGFRGSSFIDIRS